MENSNSKPDDAKIKDGLGRYKPIKRPSADIDNPLVKMLDSIVNGLEQSLGKRTYLCGNPDCGTLIIFHKNEQRPLVCHRCGSGIKICPKCNKEYDTNANYCPFHSPPVSLIEKEVEK